MEVAVVSSEAASSEAAVVGSEAVISEISLLSALRLSAQRWPFLAQRWALSA